MPDIPGWLSPRGTAVLPLTLDGSGTDLGICADDEEGLFAWMRSRSTYFASSGADFSIFPDEAEYRRYVQPSWLKLAAVTIGDTIRKAEESTTRNSSLSVQISALSEQWRHIRPLFSAALYQGDKNVNDTRFALFTQDLGLYGAPATGSLGDLLALLDVFAHIDQLLRANMTDLIFVQRGKDKVKLYRTESDQEDFLPHCYYQENKEGCIDPFADLETPIHPIHEAFLEGVAHHNGQFLGAYLMAHLRFNDDDLSSLRRRDRIRPFLRSRVPDAYDSFDLMEACLTMALDRPLKVS